MATAKWPNPQNDTLIYIANPVEADLPGHWMPLSVMKIILGEKVQPVKKLIHKSTILTTQPSTKPEKILPPPVVLTKKPPTLPEPDPIPEPSPDITTQKATPALTQQPTTQASATEPPPPPVTTAAPPPTTAAPPPTTAAPPPTTPAPPPTTAAPPPTTTAPPPTTTTKKGPPRKPKAATDGHENRPN